MDVLRYEYVIKRKSLINVDFYTSTDNKEMLNNNLPKPN